MCRSEAPVSNISLKNASSLAICLLRRRPRRPPPMPPPSNRIAPAKPALESGRVETANLRLHEPTRSLVRESRIARAYRRRSLATKDGRMRPVKAPSCGLKDGGPDEAGLLVEA